MTFDHEKQAAEESVRLGNLTAIEICGVCGSPDLEYEIWYSPNTETFGEEVGANRYYCANCDGENPDHHRTTVADCKPGAYDRAVQWADLWQARQLALGK